MALNGYILGWSQEMVVCPRLSSEGNAPLAFLHQNSRSLVIVFTQKLHHPDSGRTYPTIPKHT